MKTRISILSVLLFFVLITSSLLSLGSKETARDFESYAASQKGVEIIGTILNTSQNANQNVALIKILSSKSTQAKQVGSSITLDDTYTITAVENEYIQLEGSKKIRLYKYGFTPAESAPKESAAEKKAVAITGSYKEEGFEREDNNIKITEEYRKNLIEKDLPKVMMQAAAEAQMDQNGNITGFGLYDIEKDSAYAKAGFVDGDVIKSINGEQLDSAPNAIKTLNSMKSANNISVIIERGGQSLTLSLDVK